MIMKGMCPCAPSLTQLRHAVEYEPDARPVCMVAYPVQGGHAADAEYGSALQISREAYLPREYSVHATAGLWTESNQATPALEKDGVHPRPEFAKYLLAVAINAACREDRAGHAFEHAPGLPLTSTPYWA